MYIPRLQCDYTVKQILNALECVSLAYSVTTDYTVKQRDTLLELAPAQAVIEDYSCITNDA